MGRGTTDGVFVVKEATNKRRNAGEEGWVLFVDLAKAFDSVPRVGMLAILKKFGIKGGGPLGIPTRRFTRKRARRKG